MTIVVTDPEQVSDLGWVGSHHFDSERFDAVTAYVLTCSSKEDIRRALYLMSVHGMGIDAPVSDEDIDSFLTYFWKTDHEPS